VEPDASTPAPALRADRPPKGQGEGEILEAEEEKPILVWRPARFEGGRRPHTGRHGQRPGAEGEAGERKGGRRDFRKRHGKDGKPAEPKVLWSADDPRPPRP